MKQSQSGEDQRPSASRNITRIVCNSKFQYRIIDFKVYSLQPAFEDGTDTGFRNVGQLQLQIDAGEIPKRTYTISVPCSQQSLTYPHPKPAYSIARTPIPCVSDPE
jgi:hypothetical protein